VTNPVERLTDAEEKIRDRMLKPLFDLLIPPWINPNHITGLRLVLVASAIIIYMFHLSLTLQIYILSAAALTDLIDGPLARLRGLSSRGGAYLDQIADWFLGAWAGILLLTTGLLPSVVIMLMVVPQIGVFATDRIRASRLENTENKALTIFMGAANFRPTTIARLQFVTVLLGFMFLLLGKVTDTTACYRIGMVSLYLEILLVWLLLLHGIIRVVKKEQ